MKESSDLNVMLVVSDDDPGEFSYVLAETVEEALEVVADDWGIDDDRFLLDIVVLGPAPPGLTESDIVKGRFIMSETLLISWLLERVVGQFPTQDTGRVK